MPARSSMISVIVGCALVMLCCLLPLQAWAADTVNLNFDNAEYSYIFRILAQSAGLNALIDPSVGGKGTFTLKDVSVKEALDLIAEVGGMGYRLKGKTLLIATKDRLRELETRQLSFLQVKYLAPESVRAALSLVLDADDIYVQPETGLVVLQGIPSAIEAAEIILDKLDEAEREHERAVVSDVLEVPHVDVVPETILPEPVPESKLKIYHLDYGDPEMVFNALTMLLPEEQMRLNLAGNAVIVRATPEELKEVDSLVEELDQPLPQVLLEVWVQEMAVDAVKALGIDWQGTPSFLPGADKPTFVELKWEPWELILALKALEDEGKAKLLANPKIATVDGKEASIFVGDRVPISLTGKEGETHLEFLESGINLKVTPRVSEGEYVTIQVRPEVSTFIWRGEDQHPQIRTREAETEVRVKSGQPIVIGGLLQEQEDQLITKVPFVSELPILGRLFQWRETKTFQTEMTIFLVPRIISEEQNQQSPMDQSFFTSAQ